MHLKQILDDYRTDEMCVNIEQSAPDADIYVTLTRQHEDYHACVPSDMEHDDWVAENMDDVSVEVFSVIELDMSNRSDSTESCWLTWDQIEATQAWDYTPLCMSLVARVSSDVEGTTRSGNTNTCTTLHNSVSSSPLCTTATTPSSTLTTT